MSQEVQPITTRKIALGVAWGVLAALAIVWLLWSASQPSDLECATQRLNAAAGKIPYSQVDDACR